MKGHATDYLVFDQETGTWREDPEQAVRDDVEKHYWLNVLRTVLKDWRLYLMLVPMILILVFWRYLPMYELALEPVTSEVKSYVPFDEAVETFNRQSSRPLFVVSATPVLNEKHSKAYFAYIDSLSAVISDISQLNVAPQALLLRAVTYSSIQNFEAAIDDLSTYLQMDSLSSLALWQRAVCQSKINDFQASEGTST